MAGEINRDAIRCAREWYPKADISGSGGPWAVVRFNYRSRPAIVFFPSHAEASAFGAMTGDRLVEFCTPIPKVTRELGWD